MGILISSIFFCKTFCHSISCTWRNRREFKWFEQLLPNRILEFMKWDICFKSVLTNWSEKLDEERTIVKSIGYNDSRLVEYFVDPRWISTCHFRSHATVLRHNLHHSLSIFVLTNSLGKVVIQSVTLEMSDLVFLDTWKFYFWVWNMLIYAATLLVIMLYAICCLMLFITRF